MKIYRFIFFFVFVIVVQTALAQTIVRHKKIPCIGSFRLDSLPVIAETIECNAPLDAYYFDPSNGIFKWIKPMNADSISISYRVVQTDISIVYSAGDKESIVNNLRVKPLKAKRSSSFLRSDNIQYNGSFGRSVSAGNTQNANFNSQLNLTLSGFIADSIEINAALTDNNIPIQPDGVTQQLNEFDRILIQFKKKNRELNLGDVDVIANRLPYLQFYKRMQGFSYIDRKSSDSQKSFTVSGAVAKGKFTRNIFFGNEGNQGPYRLTGNNREIYFTVLAATEKVFINGERMQRGEDADYIINYNTAEIIFTTKRFITKDSRIQVEFEYADRNYLNSVLYAEQHLPISKKLQVAWGVYSSADAKNGSLNNALTAEQKQFLSSVGDRNEQAYYYTAQTDSFDVTKIMYAKKDTLINGTSESFYVYSTDKATAKFLLNFSEVGALKGNYILSAANANGKVYEWIAPLNGIPQGNYEPAELLVTPKQHQLGTFAMAYQPNTATDISINAALSRYDVNTFSRKDDEDNNGTAVKISARKSFSFSNSVKTTLTGSYEKSDQNFRTVERLRDVEFSREWGLPLLPQFANEEMIAAGFNVRKGDDSLLYSMKRLERSDNYKGFNHVLLYAGKHANIEYRTGVTATKYSYGDQNGNYFKPFAEILRTFSNWNKVVVGVRYENERSVQKKWNSINENSFSFQSYSAFLRSSEDRRIQWEFNYLKRTTELPLSGKMFWADESDNYSFRVSTVTDRKHAFNVQMHFRDLRSKLNLNNETEKTLTAKAEYYFKTFKDGLRLNVSAETGAGQEQKRSISFFEVPAGRGAYAWLDYNNDGIQQINEFEIA